MWNIKHSLFVLIFLSMTFLCCAQDSLGYLNQYCTSKKDCGTYGYVCMRNRTCQCDRLYISDANKERCLGGVGQDCKYDEHCIDGAFCEHQTKCQCKEDYYASFDGLMCSASPQLILNLSAFFVIIWVLIFF